RRCRSEAAVVSGQPEAHSAFVGKERRRHRRQRNPGADRGLSTRVRAHRRWPELGRLCWPSDGYCVAIASRARASCCSASSSKLASLTSTITLTILPVNRNGDSYRSETGETVSQPTSKPSLTVK